MADSVGERLKRLRHDKKMSLRELARVADVPLSTLSAVESGGRMGRKLTLETGMRLARALGVTLDYLAGMYDGMSELEPAVVELVGAEGHDGSLIY